MRALAGLLASSLCKGLQSELAADRGLARRR
jgi:hypothetical protein